jgi:hypothetical protein
MNKLQRGLDWYCYRVFRLGVIAVILGAIATFLSQCQSRNDVPKAAAAMAKNGAATTKNLALLDGEKLTAEVIQAYDEAFTELESKCREPRHQLIYMVDSLTRRYKNAHREMDRLTMATQLYGSVKRKQARTSCKIVYAEVLNLPNRKLP